MWVQSEKDGRTCAEGMRQVMLSVDGEGRVMQLAANWHRQFAFASTTGRSGIRVG